MIAEFQQSLEIRGYSNNTIDSYLYDLNKVRRILPYSLEEVTSESIIRIFTSHKDVRKWANTTKLRLCQTLKLYYTYCGKYSITEALNKYTRTIKSDKTSKSILTEEEVFKIIDSIPPTTIYNKRNRLLIAYMFFYCLKIEQALVLTTSHLYCMEERNTLTYNSRINIPLRVSHLTKVYLLSAGQGIDHLFTSRRSRVLNRKSAWRIVDSIGINYGRKLDTDTFRISGLHRLKNNGWSDNQLLDLRAQREELKHGCSKATK